MRWLLIAAFVLVALSGCVAESNLEEINGESTAWEVTDLALWRDAPCERYSQAAPDMTCILIAGTVENTGIDERAVTYDARWNVATNFGATYDLRVATDVGLLPGGKAPVQWSTMIPSDHAPEALRVTSWESQTRSWDLPLDDSNPVQMMDTSLERRPGPCDQWGEGDCYSLRTTLHTTWPRTLGGGIGFQDSTSASFRVGPNEAVPLEIESSAETAPTEMWVRFEDRRDLTYDLADVLVVDADWPDEGESLTTISAHIREFGGKLGVEVSAESFHYAGDIVAEWTGPNGDLTQAWSMTPNDSMGDGKTSPFEYELDLDGDYSARYTVEVSVTLSDGRILHATDSAYT